MIGWTDDMVCYFKRLTIEGVVNEHPATCSSVYVFSFSCHIILCTALCHRQLHHHCLQASRQTGQLCFFLSWDEAEKNCNLKLGTKCFKTNGDLRHIEEYLFDLTVATLSHSYSFTLGVFFDIH